jgi:hypothetical protein
MFPFSPLAAHRRTRAVSFDQNTACALAFCRTEPHWEVEGKILLSCSRCNEHGNTGRQILGPCPHKSCFTIVIPFL